MSPERWRRIDAVFQAALDLVVADGAADQRLGEALCEHLHAEAERGPLDEAPLGLEGPDQRLHFAAQGLVGPALAREVVRPLRARELQGRVEQLLDAPPVVSLHF